MNGYRICGSLLEAPRTSNFLCQHQNNRLCDHFHRQTFLDDFDSVLRIVYSDRLQNAVELIIFDWLAKQSVKKQMNVPSLAFQS